MKNDLSHFFEPLPLLLSWILRLIEHLIIDNNNVTVFPVSKQLLRYDNNKISYCGNTYINNNESLSINIKKMI